MLVPCFGSLVRRPRVQPGAPLSSKPLQALQVASPCSGITRDFVPWTALSPQILQDVQVTAPRSRSAGSLIPRAALASSPLQALEVALSR